MAKKKTREQLWAFVLKMVQAGYRFSKPDWNEFVLGAGYIFSSGTVNFAVDRATALDWMLKRKAQREAEREQRHQARR